MRNIPQYVGEIEGLGAISGDIRDGVSDKKASWPFL
jgi:hypothetical protein